MNQYKQLIKDVFASANQRTTRNNHQVLSSFMHTSTYDLREGFPILTTKKISFHNVYWELIWFLRGDTNIKFLLRKGVNIWNADAYREYCKHSSEGKMTQEEFVKRVKTDNWFAYQFGFLGNIYGKQWRSWKTRSDKSIDQIANVIKSIKNNPNSRRHIVTAWNVADIDKMAVPPCHTLCQFYVQDDYLDCMLYQRSGDVFLGVPYNISSYSLLLTIIAHLTNKKARFFKHIIADAHIYVKHIKQCELILQREAFDSPILSAKEYSSLKELTDSNEKMYELVNYQSHSRIAAELLV